MMKFREGTTPVFGLFNAIGWLGGALIALAYVLVSTRRLVAEAPTFQSMNILGAVMVGLASLHQHAMPSAGLNLVWVLIGMQSLTVGLRRRERPRKSTYSESSLQSVEAPTQPGLAGRVSVS